MKKPKPEARMVIDFSECTDFIENKYGINTRDYANSHRDFERWCKKKKEKPTNCPANCSDKVMKAHQKQWARYQSDVAAGRFTDNPYQDFWHWLLTVADINRGGTVILSKDMGEGAEPWQQHILGLYLKEFGEGPYLTEW